MRDPLKRLTVIALMMTMLLVAFLPSTSAVPASAPAPEWNVGDQWGYSSNVYLDPSDGNVTDTIEQVVASFDGELEKMVFNASLGAYIYVKVVEETADQYVLMTVFCSEMKAMVDIKVKAMMPVEGVYDMWTEIPQENKTVRVQLDLDYLVYMSTNLTLNKDTLAIEEIDSFNALQMNLDFLVENIYSNNLEGTNWNVTYENYDVRLDAAVFLNLTIGFSPSLNLYDFPLSVGDGWDSISMATLTGDLSGTIDAQGLPEDALEDISDSDDEMEFPIDLSDYTGELGDGLIITNGTIDQVNEEISAELKCTRMMEVAEEDFGNGTIQIFEVSVNDGELLFYYSPDLGFFHGLDATSTLVTDNMGDIGVDLPLSLDEGAMMSMEYQPASETAKKIESLSGYEVDGIANEDEPQGGMPYLFAGVIIALAALAVVFGIVMYRKKKKSP